MSEQHEQVPTAEAGGSILELSSRLADRLIACFAPEHATTSLDPATLQSIHRLARGNDHLAHHALMRLERTRGHKPLAVDLARCELLLALGFLTEAHDVALDLLTRAPSDLRCQDVAFRAEHYLDHGLPEPEAVGRELAGTYCGLPFRKMDFLVGGDVTLCCSAWMRQSVGNLFRDPVSELWNGQIAQDIRRHILEGSYRYCGKKSRSFIVGRKLPKLADQPREVRLDGGPQAINLSFDKTCNLYCPSCRSGPIAAREAERQVFEQVIETTILPLLRDASSLEVTGSGDPFASKTFRRLLRRLNRDEFPRLGITIMTNGVLATPAEWAKLEALKGMIVAINVSADAARSETYDVVRPGGNFEALRRNIAHIGQLRRDGFMKSFRMCFVVQERNFMEMPDFVRWAADAGADAVHFQLLLDWGVLPPDQYRAQAIHLPSHPRHQAFLEVLRDPVLRSPLVRGLAWEFAHLVP